MAEPLCNHQVSGTALKIPNLCFGMAPIGNMPDTYGHGISEETARSVVRAVLDGPIPFLDVSRNYGLGRAETRIGEVIAERGGLPEGFVVASKLDRDTLTGKFDGAQARKSLEESLKALNLDRIHILHLHDPEYAASIDEVRGRGGAAETLFRLKEEGYCDAVGLAAGKVDIMDSLLNEFSFDLLLTHNRYTLVNRNANALIDKAISMNVTVLNAAPYSSGVLAKGSGAGARYVYQEASDAMLAPVRKMETIAARFDVPLGALALQFSMRDPRITSTVLGVGTIKYIAETVKWASIDIPAEAFDAVSEVEVTSADPEATRQYSTDSLG